MTTKTAERHWEDMWKDEDDEPLLPSRFAAIASSPKFEKVPHGDQDAWW